MSDLPGPRCGQYVSGGIASYPCWEEANHEGPCAATEVPASQARRRQWLEEQAHMRASMMAHMPQSAVEPPSGPVAGVPSPPAALRPEMLSDPLQRQQEILARLSSKDFRALPDWVKQGIIGSSAQVSLATLYHLAKQQFDAGATVVTLTPEFLDRLTIPVVRDFIDLFVNQSQKEH
jgi:hypothetical protein